MTLGLSEEELFVQGHRSCAGCGCALAMRYALKAAGKDTIVCNATGCMEVVSSPYPQTSWKVPWIHAAFENAAAVASGVERSLKKLNKKSNVLVIAGDGGTFDIGFQALSGAFERGHNITFLCYDNGAYMNTGVQRSGATPKYTATTTTPAGSKVHGKKEFKKDMPFIVAAHGAYVATANIAYPQDFTKKMQKAIEFNGPSYVQVYAPCVIGWKIPSNITIKISKLAFEAKIYPMYEIENGVLKFTLKPSKDISVVEYLKLQGRFKHMVDDEINDTQNHVNERWDKLIKIEKSGLKIF